MIQNIQVAWRYTNTIGKIILIWYLLVVIPAMIIHELSHLLILVLFFNFSFEIDYKFLEYNGENKSYDTYLQGSYTTSNNILGMLTSISPMMTLVILIYCNPVFMIIWCCIGGLRGFLLSKTDIESFKISFNNLIKSHYVS